jgi:hypothetical protein
VYWKTLYAGYFPHGSQEETNAAFKRWYGPMREVKSVLQSFGTNDSDTGGIFSKLVTLTRWVVKVLYMILKMSLIKYRNENEQPRIMAVNRRIVRTTQNYIGIASAQVQVGDYIALFNGGKMPFVIREAQSGAWQIISDVYVHGIMNGEEFDSTRCEMLRLL